MCYTQHYLFALYLVQLFIFVCFRNFDDFFIEIFRLYTTLYKYINPLFHLSLIMIILWYFICYDATSFDSLLISIIIVLFQINFSPCCLTHFFFFVNFFFLLHYLLFFALFSDLFICLFFSVLHCHPILISIYWELLPYLSSFFYLFLFDSLLIFFYYLHDLFNHLSSSPFFQSFLSLSPSPSPYHIWFSLFSFMIFINFLFLFLSSIFIYLFLFSFFS